MSYKVTIEPSGHTLDVAEGESVLEAALRQGVILPYSCRGGNCGACGGDVISGSVHYPQGRPGGLSEQAEAEGKALLCQAQPRGDLTVKVRELTGSKEIPPRKVPCRVARIEELAHDVRRIYLQTAANQRLQFLAGQYVDILLKDGRRRGFSLANAPHDDELLELHIRRVAGGEFTNFVFEGLKEKALLRLEGPLGQFYLREDSARPILLMAGGTGFAPVKGIIEHAFHIGVQRPIHLFWGVRARRDLYLDRLALAWTRQHANFQYTPVLSEPLPEDRWEGASGLVHEALLQQYPQLRMFDVYVGGPPAMVTAAKTQFMAHGLDPEHFYADAFEFAAKPKVSAQI